MKAGEFSLTSVCTYQTVLHVSGGRGFFRKVDIFLLNYTPSYTERQQNFPKLRCVHNTLHDYLHIQRQEVAPQLLSLSSELHRLTRSVTACPFEKYLTFHQITQRYFLAGSKSHSHGRENLKCRNVYKIFSKMSLKTSETIRGCVFYIYFAE
jgi:hypothetical protein